MAEKPKTAAPPYATFAAFLNFINKLRDTGVPARIDPSVFGNASGSLSYSVIASLKALKLIGADGVPTAVFNGFVKAGDEDRKEVLRGILREGYPSLWDGSIDLATATPGQFDDHFRQHFDAKGSTIDKIAAFFLSAAKVADMPISAHLKARKPIAASSTASKSKRQRKSESVNNDADLPPPPPAVPTIISDKALEYKLIDLLKEDVGENERSAIWTLVQYLAAKSRQNAVD